MAQYDRNPPLTEADVLPDPLAQFQRWLADAQADHASGGLVEPTAMALGTVSAEGQPSVRIVLFKGLHEGGFTFYTNYDSRKGAELAARPQAALTFWWDRLERQVRIEGRVERLAAADSEAYFNSRPVGSRLGAIASHQSAPIADRAALEKQYEEAQRQYGDQSKRPEHWGGYRLVPDAMEFWQGRPSRLHDRIQYLKQTDGTWQRQRLQP